MVELAPRPELPPAPARAMGAGPGPQSAAAAASLPGVPAQQSAAVRLAADAPMDWGDSPGMDALGALRQPQRASLGGGLTPGELRFSPGMAGGGSAGRGAAAAGASGGGGAAAVNTADLPFQCPHPGCNKAR